MQQISCAWAEEHATTHLAALPCRLAHDVATQP